MRIEKISKKKFYLINYLYNYYFFLIFFKNSINNVINNKKFKAIYSQY